MTKLLVTVAMPVRNCEKTIAAAVRSVLNQTFQDWEMLVVDDGSSDGTVAEVRRFEDKRIMLHLDGQSKGLPARLNEAIGVASGEYFARMDGDDVCYPGDWNYSWRFSGPTPRWTWLGAASWCLAKADGS